MNESLATIAQEWAKSQSRIIDVLEAAAPRPCFGYFTRLQENEKKETESLRSTLVSFGYIAA